MTFEFGRCDFQRKIQMFLLKRERMSAQQATTADTLFFGVFQVSMSIIIYWDPTCVRKMARNFGLHQDELCQSSEERDSRPPVIVQG